jgi:hypothetical protein
MVRRVTLKPLYRVKKVSPTSLTIDGIGELTVAEEEFGGKRAPDGRSEEK